MYFSKCLKKLKKLHENFGWQMSRYIFIETVRIMNTGLLYSVCIVSSEKRTYEYRYVPP